MRDKYISFGSADFKRHAKITRRAAFLNKMERIVPWEGLKAIIEPHYPKGEVGRRPIRLDLMIRIHLLQQWYDLSDPGAEEALYDVLSMQRFAGIDLGTAPAPDETTICKFRHLLEKHDLGKRMFEEINAHLERNGVKIGTGTIVDATIINAPSSTKNQKKERDPEMHSTCKGNQWYFGMKAHIGVDSTSKIVHTLETSAANVHDSKMLAQLLHGTKRGSGVMRLTPATRSRCERRLPVHRISRASEDIAIARSPKPSWQRTSTSHRLDRGLSTSLGSSKGCSAFAKSGSRSRK